MHDVGRAITAERTPLIQFQQASVCLVNHRGTRVTQYNYLFRIRSGGIWIESQTRNQTKKGILSAVPWGHDPWLRGAAQPS